MRSPINFYHLYHDTTAFTFFIKIGIWEILQVPRHFGNFPNSLYLRVVYFKNFGNFSNYWIFGEFPKNLDIWEISQIPRNLGKFPYTQAFGKFPTSL